MYIYIPVYMAELDVCTKFEGIAPLLKATKFYFVRCLCYKINTPLT